MAGSGYSDLQGVLTFAIMLLVRFCHLKRATLSLPRFGVSSQVSSTLLYFAAVVTVDIQQQLQTQRVTAGVKEAARSLWNRKAVLATAGVAAGAGISARLGSRPRESVAHVVSNPLFVRSEVRAGLMRRVRGRSLQCLPRRGADQRGRRCGVHPSRCRCGGRAGAGARGCRPARHSVLRRDAAAAPVVELQAPLWAHARRAGGRAEGRAGELGGPAGVTDCLGHRPPSLSRRPFAALSMRSATRSKSRACLRRMLARPCEARASHWRRATSAVALHRLAPFVPRPPPRLEEALAALIPRLWASTPRRHPLVCCAPVPPAP